MANSTAERQIVSLKIVHTSDVHGSFFMRDYVNNHAVRGSLSRVVAEGLWGQIVADGRRGHIAGESRGVLQ